MARSRTYRITIAMFTATALVLLTSLPASAERWSRQDSRSDGYVGGNISRLTAANRKDHVTIKVHFSDLIRRKARYNAAVIRTHRQQKSDYILYTHWNGRRYVNHLIRGTWASDAPAGTVACPNKRVHWEPLHDRILIQLPQQCLRRPTPGISIGFYTANRRAGDWAPGRYANMGPWLALS